MPKRYGSKTKKRVVRKKQTNYVHKVARQEARKVVNGAIETKMYDVDQVADAVNWDGFAGLGNVYSLTLGQIRGLAENQYIADSITPVGIVIRYKLTIGDATQLMRMVLIQNKAGGVPLITTVFQNVGTANAPLSPLNNNYQNTYRVISDKLFSLDGIRNNIISGTWRIPWSKLRKLYYNDAIGTIEKGGIYLCIVSDSGAIPNPTIQFHSRLYFKDA